MKEQREGTDDFIEAEANKFAVELLMPSDMVRKDVEAETDCERGNLVEKLAKKYQVSEQTVAMRLLTLKL